jgi:hypothetical protein
MPFNVWMWSSLKYIYRFRHLPTEDKYIIQCGLQYSATGIRKIIPVSKHHNTNTYKGQRSRVGLRHVGTVDRLIILCPLKPIFSKHFRPRTGQANSF